MPTAVIPFQLMVGGRGAGGYGLRATAAGRAAEAALELPPLAGDAEALGLALGRALFPPPVRQLLIDVARGADEAGARVQIQLQVAPPELAALPWEWATLGSEAPWRPAVREDYTLVRSGRPARRGAPLALDGPLRLLIACAPGSTAAAAPLGHALAEAVDAGRLTVDLLRDADPLTLREALDEEPCHVLHLVADDATGSAAAARIRLGRGLDAAGLAGIVEDRPELRLVTLAAAPGAPGDTLADLAADLHRQLGVAAVALGQLGHGEAAAFCGPCYTALALGDPLDLAVTDGRAALAAGGGPWGAPRVWLAPGSEQLFEPTPPRTAPARAAAPEPAPAPPSLAVGTPVRQRREPAAPGGPARALAAARSFVVEATQVGEPAQRARTEPRRPAVQPKLVALAAACVALALMVSRVLPTAGPAEAGPAAEATAAAAPGAQATAGPGSPLDVAQPRSYATYLAAPGDTLESVAARAGSEPAALAALNRLAPGEPLREGRPLVVPVYRDGEPLPAAPIVNRGNPAQPLVALTFDIEIDGDTLYGILDIMDARGVKGTFFVTGKWVESFPDAAKAIVERGHEIANHSLTHPAFSSIGPDGAANELRETERIVREVTGASTRPYFRFPYGDSTPAIVEAVAREGYVAYHWSADDVAIAGWIARAAENPADAGGGILLMHGRQSTVDNLAGYIDQLEAAGLTPTTLGAVLR
jgi:peptidoglycan/xylan/chitin deacetylase (PgdA/CDA1 family)